MCVPKTVGESELGRGGERERVSRDWFRGEGGGGAREGVDGGGRVKSQSNLGLIGWHTLKI